MTPCPDGIIAKYFHLSLLDLIPSDEIEHHLRAMRSPHRSTQVPFLERPVGPGMPWVPDLDGHKNFQLPFPTAHAPANLVMASLIPDSDMRRTLGAAEIALLDLSPGLWSNIEPEALFVVERGGEAVIRYVRPGARRYYLATDANLGAPADWEPFPVSAAELSVAIKARVRWIGRERDQDAVPQRGRFLYDPISS